MFAAENTAKDVAEDQFDRPENFETRRPKQINTHAFPTTSIGSFPQTAGEFSIDILLFELLQSTQSLALCNTTT